MVIPDLFSARQKREKGGTPDVFVYDKLPSPLRVQITYLISDAIGSTENELGNINAAGEVYISIYDILCRHLGRRHLVDSNFPADEQLTHFLQNEPNVGYCLDAIELSFRHIELLDRHHQRWVSKLEPAEAIADLNQRFLEHGVGYQYGSGKIIRIDSQFLHAEVVKPTLALLRDKRYQGANDEFLKAHEDYRKGDVKDCLGNSLKALESTLKTICKSREWPYTETDAAKALLDICFRNNLVPTFWASHFSSLRSTLESSVPTVRNKLGGHGQGPEVVTVPPHYAAYALHMTGSAIQFLVDAEKALS